MNQHVKDQTTEKTPLSLLTSVKRRRRPSVDMAQVVGRSDILMICLDTLRYDVAVQEEEGGRTPALSHYGKWEKRQAPGNFTWPSHHAMFAGFFPVPYDTRDMWEREVLFFSSSIGLGRKVPEGAYGFSGGT